MDASFSDLLRWLLLGIGVLIIIVVYWFSRRGQSKPFPSQRVVPEFPRDVVEAGESAPDGEAAEESTELQAEERSTSPAPFKQNSDNVFTELETPSDVKPASEPGGRLLVLHVRSKSKREFAGADILRIAEQAGLERAVGSSGGFFQCSAPSPDDPPLFYIANMFSPGVFKWSEMDTFSTAGLSLFAQLPGVLPPLKAFDALLECARRFANDLQGSVCDESRSDLTVQTIQHIKEDLQTYAMGRAAPTAGK